MRERRRCSCRHVRRCPFLRFSSTPSALKPLFLPVQNIFLELTETARNGPCVLDDTNSFPFMHVLESGAALAPALPCVCLLRNMAIRSCRVSTCKSADCLRSVSQAGAADSFYSECDVLTEAGCVRAMAQIFKRAFAVQSITPAITHHPILQQACGTLSPHAHTKHLDNMSNS